MATKQISILVDEVLLGSIDGEAARLGRSRNWVINRWLEGYGNVGMDLVSEKKIAEVSAGCEAQGGVGGTPGLSRGGKAQLDAIDGDFAAAMLSNFREAGERRDASKFPQASSSSWIKDRRMEFGVERINNYGQQVDANGIREIRSDQESDTSGRIQPGSEGGGKAFEGVRSSGNSKLGKEAGEASVGKSERHGKEIKFPQWSEERMREMAAEEPGGLMACSPELLREMKDAAREDSGVAGSLYLAGVELDGEVVAKWGLANIKIPKIKQEGENGVESGGKERKGRSRDGSNIETVTKGANDAESGSVGVGKPQVNMELLRDICAGKIPATLGDGTVCDEGLVERTEVDLCGFKSFNETDGEWYMCCKEKHEYPKIRHGEWVKV